MRRVRSAGLCRKGSCAMLIFNVLLFAVATFIISFQIAHGVNLDNAKVAASATMIAWGSMLYGIYLAKACF
jgi:hypothetical protein